MSDNVEFRHLEYLVAIAERKNFSKAAEHVYRSQPAVSHQIKTLESDLGFPLLIRDGRNGVHPTPAGELVLNWARNALAERRDIFRIAKAIHEGAVPPLHLGFSSFVNAFLLENFRQAYQAMFPGCEIHLSSGVTEHILDRLEQSLLDCALLPMPINSDSCTVRSVARSPLVVCMRTDDPLCPQSQVDLREISARLRVFRDPDLHRAAHARLIQMFQELGLSFKVDSSAATPTDMLLMVKQGYGLALIDQLWPLEEGLTTRPLRGLAWTVDTGFVAPKGYRHMALSFLEKYLDENDLGQSTNRRQPTAVRRPRQLKLLG